MRGDLEISVAKTGIPKDKPSFENLGFGKHFTDHMFIMDWRINSRRHYKRFCPQTRKELEYCG